MDAAAGTDPTQTSPGATSGAIRFYRDADDRVMAFYAGTDGGAGTATVTPAGNTIAYGVDVLNRLVRRKSGVGSPAFSFSYDPANNLLTASNETAFFCLPHCVGRNHASGWCTFRWPMWCTFRWPGLMVSISMSRNW